MATEKHGRAILLAMTSKAATTRAAILERGSRLASIQGLGDMTIGVLAADVRMSKSGLYAHFRSKEALQLAVLDAVADRFVAAVIAPTEEAGSPLLRLRRLVELWCSWTTSSLPGGCLLLSAATEFDDQPGEVRDRIVAIHQAWRDLLEVVIADAANAGELDPATDAGQLAFELTGAVLTCHHAHRLLRDPAAERRAKHALNSLIAGRQANPSER
ncbi:TetR/AcrR family transcriptional regulator [Streptomyces sp. NPDC059340]|uniref:TetR/AcrR family transcriptional regulator n=1 Tax=Streptomyces sp. NPDC059340 TaxID=3346806 RepID=UPI00368BC567